MEQRVWIEEGCIQCGWCQNLESEIFVLSEHGMVIRAEARVDQCRSDNREERSPLTPPALAAVTPLFLQFITDGCPTRVIKLDPPTAGDFLS